MASDPWRRLHPVPLTTRRRRRLLRTVAAVLVLAGAVCAGVALALAPAVPAFADGPAPCSVGGPPFPSAGFCATYSGANTWYGSYGPGFPTDEGWGFCADPPASGGDYPAPAYDYRPAGAPAGADTSEDGALGFAFSEAQALGWWGGSPGTFTADQAAVAGKLLYDSVVWASPVPAMDPGVLAAYNALDGWFVQARGSDDVPTISIGLAGGQSSFTGTAEFQAQVSFPDTNGPLSGLALQLAVTGATFETASGPDTITVATDATGSLSVPVVAGTPGPVSVTVTAQGLGASGLDFFTPTADELTAQSLVGFSAPSSVSLNAQLSALPTTGTVSVVKDGNDLAYYPVAGAVFEVLSGSSVVATLTTGPDGTTGQSPPLDAGPYVVHEETPPPGYGAAPDQSVTVTAGTDTEVDYTGPAGDAILTSSLSIEKQDADTGAPLSGAVFDVIYDSQNDGTFDVDLGNCTTNAAGECSPPGNAGAGLLPGRYRVTETAAPPGYGLPTPASQVIDLVADETGSVIFGDPRLVSAVFQKTATGNVNPEELSLAGATMSVTEGSPTGPSVARCSTNAAGTCTTAAVLVSGSRYCWAELSPPPGLEGGANGCFTAQDGQADQPIAVSDAGMFVAIVVKKVDAANPAAGLPGAVFDLYREPSTPSASVGGNPAPRGSGQVLVGTTTTGTDGIGTFGLQLPGFAYCAVEVTPPANYEGDADPECTAVLTGTTAVPPPVTTLTFQDTEETLSLSVFKYNSLQPSTVIPGATYDLYVEGSAPPSGVSGPTPNDAATEPGDTWYGRGTTGADGRLSFTVPAGYAWCVHEQSAPPDYVLDPALHCSDVVTTSSPTSETTIAVPEVLETVHITAYKYNSEQPDTVIPGATYELVAQGAPPPGTPDSAPPGTVVPLGDSFFAEGTTDANGALSFAVPAGFSWCLRELSPPRTTAPTRPCTAPPSSTPTPPVPPRRSPFPRRRSPTWPSPASRPCRSGWAAAWPPASGPLS